MPIERANKIIIGKITTTHGYKGELKIMPLTDFPERFEAMTVVEVDRNGVIKELTIENIRKNKAVFIVKFQEITNMSEAELFRNSLIYVDQTDIMPLPKDRYYHFQLIGLKVFANDGSYLGKVKTIMEPGGHDILVVNNEQTKEELLIPMVKAWVSKINTEEGYINVEMLPGLR